MHKVIMLAILAVAVTAARAELPIPAVEKPTAEKPASKDKKAEAKKEEALTPPANGVIEVMKDGKIKWGADHDTVARVLLKTIQDYDRELQKQRLLNDILIEEVAKLRSAQK